MLFLILTYLPSLICGIHAVRSGQQMYWLWILVIAPLLGPAIYFFAVLVPEFAGGRTARGVTRAAQQALDPERELRLAKQALTTLPRSATGCASRKPPSAWAAGRRRRRNGRNASKAHGPKI